VSVSVSVTNSTGVCSEIFTQTTTITATDRCGNTASAVQVINGIVSKPPILLGVPPSTRVSCENIPAPPTVTALDLCNRSIPVTFLETRTNGSCPNAYRLTRTWTTTDVCGQTVSQQQTIDVVDNTPPLLIGVPADERVLCGFIPCAANVTAIDNCPGVTIRFTEVLNPGRTCCDFTLTRTWTATDACGNTATARQNLTSFFNLPPILNVPPNPPCIDCDKFNGTLPPANVSAFRPPLASGYCINSVISADAQCGISSPVPDNIQFTSGSTSYNLVFNSASTVIVYADGEVNLVGQLQDASSNAWKLELHLENERKLVNLSGYNPPLELNQSCYDFTGTQPGLVDPNGWRYFVALTGVLSGNGATFPVTASVSRPSQFGAGANGRNRQYGATLFAMIAGQTVPIRLDVRAEGPDCVFDASQLPELKCNISLPITTTVTELPSRCPQEKIFNRTFCVTDSLDNVPITICGSQIIRTCDFVAPTINTPPPRSIECDQPVPSAGGSTVDNCDTNPIFNVSETRVNGPCPFTYSLIRTYRSTDHCGNTNQTTSRVDVADTTPPVITGVPEARNVFCFLPPVPPINATDNCGIDYTQWPKITSQRLPPGIPGLPVCPQNFLQRYFITARDLCGNQANATFDVLVRNDIPPRLFNVPADITIPCNASIPTASVTANSTCEGDLTNRIRFTTTQTTAVCGAYVITNTWTVSDSCNQTATATQRITVTNPFGPLFTLPLPQNQTVSCEAIPAVPTVTGSSLCGNASVSFTTANSSGSCANSYKIIRTWTLTDCLSRTISFTQVITVVDNTPPTITPATPAVVNASCNDVPLPPDVCASDNCPGLSISFTEVRRQLHENPQCARYTLNRTWTAIDACGLTASTNQLISVFDNTPPVCVPPQTPDTINCLDLYTPPPPVCTDDCSNVTVVLSSSTLPGPLNCSASKILFFSWRATDACGNFVVFNASVEVTVTSTPIIQGVPGDSVLECTANAPLVNPNATDECFPQVSPIVNVQSVPGACPNIRTDFYTFTVVNPCGTPGQSANFSVKYVDTTAPTFNVTLPPNVTVQCDQIPAIPDISGLDICGAAAVSFRQTNTSGSCANSYTIFRTWTLSDCTGNNASYTQRIDVIDTTPPVLELTAQNVTVDCKNVPLPPDVCGTDNCPVSM